MAISTDGMLHLACLYLHRKAVSCALYGRFVISDVCVFQCFLLSFVEEEKNIIEHAYSELFANWILSEDASMGANIAEGD